MTFGAELLDDSYKTSIGIDYANIYFHEKLSGSIPGAKPYIAELSTSIADSSVRPLVYYYVPDQGALCCAVGVFYSGGVWRVRFAGEPGAGIQAYVFVEKSVLSSGWGMQIFGPSGELYFDSNYKNLSVTGTAEIVRGADSFFNSNNHGWLGYDWWFGGWRLGAGSALIPSKARRPKACIAAPPAFYGLGYVEQDGSFTHYDVMLACVYRDGDYVKVAGNGAGVQYLLEAGGYYQSNYDALVHVYGHGGASGGGEGKAMVNPLWDRYVVSFIDGSIYD